MNILKLVAATALSAALIAPTTTLAGHKSKGNNKGAARVEAKASKKAAHKAKKQKAGKQSGKKKGKKSGKDVTVKQGETKVFSGEEGQTYESVTGEAGSSTVFQ